MKKVGIVIVYFGVFPKYFNFFLHSCYKNVDIDFIIFSDQSYEVNNVYENILFFNTSLNDFNKLASSKLGVDINLKNGYKLCDLKPMYGVIYEDYLVDYDFWGFCDIDIVFGNLSKVINNNILNNFDVVSAHSQYLSGPFSVFRNTEDVNFLFKKSRDWLKVVTNDKVYLFDEASDVMPYLWEGKKIAEYPGEVESMTHVLNDKNKCDLRVLFAGFISERVHGSLTWSSGFLYDDFGCEIALFHYIVYKNRLNFSVPDIVYEKLFKFDKNGFYYDDVMGITLGRLSNLSNNYVHLFKKIYRKIGSLLISKARK